MKHYENSTNMLKMSNPNSLWAYIREGLLLEGYLRLRFVGGGGGYIFGRFYFQGGSLLEFYGIEKFIFQKEAPSLY